MKAESNKLHFKKQLLIFSIGLFAGIGIYLLLTFSRKGNVNYIDIVSLTIAILVALIIFTLFALMFYFKPKRNKS